MPAPSWLCKDDSSNFNMAELDVVIKGLNLTLAWEIKKCTLHFVGRVDPDITKWLMQAVFISVTPSTQLQ